MCNESPPLKSNACIVAELERLADAGGLWRLEETASCRNPECGNHGRSIARHPEAYIRRGRPASGNGQYFQCRAYGRRRLVSHPVRLHAEHQTLAADVLSRIANKSPVRGTGRGVRLRSMKTYYPIVDFIYSRCRAYSGAVDRALIDGTLRLPKAIVLETDGQDYTPNWSVTPKECSRNWWSTACAPRSCLECSAPAARRFSSGLMRSVRSRSSLHNRRLVTRSHEGRN